MICYHSPRSFGLLPLILLTDVVRLNQAVAIGFAYGWSAGLEALERLADEPALVTYGYLPAARADFLRLLGRGVEAKTAYEEALLLTENDVERRLLAGRLSDVSSSDVSSSNVGIEESK